MSYNISTVRCLSGELSCNYWTAHGYEEADETGLPEDCFIYDALNCPKDKRDEWLPLERLAWRGAFSGNLESFKNALTITRGEAELLIVWEGGDRFSGLYVKDGAVEERTVKITLEKS